jgi:ElaB/YqjD/DUF883 family membrane-anchored ribosome-binding protein
VGGRRDLQLLQTGVSCLMNAEEREFSKTLENNDQVEQLEKAMRERGQEWLETTDEWVRENPYLAMGIALAAGVAIAALICHRD